MSRKNFKKAKRNAKSALLLAALVAVAHTPVLAQESSNKATTEDSKENATLATESSKKSANSAAQTLETVDVRAKRSGYVSDVSVGGKEPVSIREVPNSVSVITQERIEEQNLKTVTDALTNVTGVTAVSNDSTQSQFYSRGYSMSVMYDGIPAYSALSGYQQFDLAIYDRVEVLRGPAGLFAGVGDPGGVVNLVRKRAPSEFALTSTTSVGSWNNYSTTIDVGGPLNEDKTLRGRAVLSGLDRDFFYDKTHDNKKLAYGTLDWSITPATTVSVAATVQQDRVKANSMGLPAWTTGGLINADRSTNMSPDWARTNTTTKELALDVDHRFDNGWVGKIKVSQRTQDLYFKDAYASTGVNPTTDTLTYSRRQYDYDYTRNGFDAYLSGPFTLLGREHKLLVGYNYYEYSYTYAGVKASKVTNVAFGHSETVSDFDLPYNLGGASRTTQSGIYSQLSFKAADPLTLIVGGRLSDFNAETRSIAPSTPTAWQQGAKANDEFTPYGGLVYDVNKNISLYASIASIFIPQTNLTSSGDMLRPRVGRQWEIGSKGEFLDKKLIASIALFNLRDKNRPMVDSAAPDYYVASGEVESSGWEVEISGSPAPGYQLQAGYTRLDTKYLKDSDDQGLVFDTWEPRHTLKLWGTKKFQDDLLRGLTLGLGANVMSGTSAGTGTSAVRSQGGFTVVNAMASYKITPKTTLALNANNLLDKVYYTRLGGTNTYNTYGDPRNFTLTLTYKY